MTNPLNLEKNLLVKRLLLKKSSFLSKKINLKINFQLLLNGVVHQGNPLLNEACHHFAKI